MSKPKNKREVTHTKENGVDVVITKETLPDGGVVVFGEIILGQ